MQHDPTTTTDRTGRAPVIRFTILGRLAVTVDGVPLEIGPPKQRLLLALLLCRPNRTSSVDLLIEALWNEDPPRTARKNLQVYVATLRKLVGGRISFAASGYMLLVAEEDLDLLRFEGYARTGRGLLRQGDLAGAAHLLDCAISSWPGPPALADFPDSAVAVRETERLDGRFLSVYEDWAEIQVGIGRYGDVLDSIDDMCDRYPFRERLGAARMTALAGCGRVAEALACYDDVRQRMAREFGIQPSPVLTALYRRILAGDNDRAVRPNSREYLPAGAAVAGTGLPRDLPDFVGRLGEIDELVELLGARHSGAHGTEVAVLTGPAGIGKTATAIRIARRLAGVFPDGVWSVSARDRDESPRRAPDLMADLLRQAGYGDVATAQAASLWRVWMAERRMLLVVDDARDEETVRALLSGLGRSRMLVTSRLRLSGLEAVSRVDLAELSTAETLDLLGHLIGSERLSADPATAERVVEYCGWVPLAIRIAGTRLATLRRLPLRLFADRLADDRSLFDEMTAGDLCVRTRFDEWMRSVPLECRGALRRLSRLPGSVLGRDDVLRAITAPGDPAEQVLGRLVETNLVSVPDVEVVAHHEVYCIGPLLRRYARGLPDTAS